MSLNQEPKVITPGSHKGQSRELEPFQSRSKNMQLTGSVEKCARARHDWFGFISDLLRTWRKFFFFFS